jgi:hypothetical protein
MGEGLKRAVAAAKATRFTDKMKAGREAATAKLNSLPSCDKPGKQIRGRLKLCSWGCGRTTRNITEIGDLCWANRDKISKARQSV